MTLGTHFNERKQGIKPNSGCELAEQWFEGLWRVTIGVGMLY